MNCSIGEGTTSVKGILSTYCCVPYHYIQKMFTNTGSCRLFPCPLTSIVAKQFSSGVQQARIEDSGKQPRGRGEVEAGDDDGSGAREWGTSPAATG